MQEFIDRFRSWLEVRGYAPATCDAYVRCARGLLRRTGKRAEDLTSDDVCRYLRWLQRDRRLHPSTCVVYAAAARHVFRVAHDDPSLSVHVPMLRVPRRLPVVLSGTAVRRLIAAIPEPHHHAIATCCYGAGLRVSEACGLRVDAIDSALGVLHIVGKGNKQRDVPMSGAVLMELRAYWSKVHPAGRVTRIEATSRTPRSVS